MAKKFTDLASLTVADLADILAIVDTSAGTSKKITVEGLLLALLSATGASWGLQSWTPTLTNITIGNGTVTAKYQRIAGLVFYQLTIVAGSTTSSSGLARFSLPQVISSNYAIGSPGDANNGHIGEVVLLNASTASFPSTTRIYDADELSILVTNAASTYALHTDTDMDASAVPFQFLTGDKIFAWGFYEPA